MFGCCSLQFATNDVLDTTGKSGTDLVFDDAMSVRTGIFESFFFDSTELASGEHLDFVLRYALLRAIIWVEFSLYAAQEHLIV